MPLQNGKPRRTFVLRGLLTLAAIYSRGTCRPTTIDVLMFHFRVRNGSGWGHQAVTTRLLLYFVLRVLPFFVLPTSYFVLQFVWLSSAFLGCCCGWQTGIRVASGIFVFQRVARFSTLITFSESCRNCLSPGVTFLLYKVCWMLVVLGSIHCCNYTCTLSTWSSSTLL